VVGVEAMQRQHGIHKVGLRLELEPVLVLVIEVDVVTGHDRRHTRRIDPRVE
jgi:hypothetical protein